MDVVKLVSIITFLSCSSSKESSNPTVIIDPNPTSEMAQLMREMTIELDQIKIRLEKNETLDNNLLKQVLILGSFLIRGSGSP